MCGWRAGLPELLRKDSQEWRILPSRRRSSATHEFGDRPRRRRSSVVAGEHPMRGSRRVAWETTKAHPCGTKLQPHHPLRRFQQTVELPRFREIVRIAPDRGARDEGRMRRTGGTPRGVTACRDATAARRAAQRSRACQQSPRFGAPADVLEKRATLSAREERRLLPDRRTHRRSSHEFRVFPLFLRSKRDASALATSPPDAPPGSSPRAIPSSCESSTCDFRRCGATPTGDSLSPCSRGSL